MRDIGIVKLKLNMKLFPFYTERKKLKLFLSVYISIYECFLIYNFSQFSFIQPNVVKQKLR